MNTTHTLYESADHDSTDQKSAIHESAVHHVQGSAAYIDDIPLTEGTLHAAPVLSTVACGQVRALDLSACLQAPGVRAVVTAADIVGDPVLAAYTHDEPIFASERVSHVGQVMALVLADTHQQAGDHDVDPQQRRVIALVEQPVVGGDRQQEGQHQAGPEGRDQGDGPDPTRGAAAAAARIQPREAAAPGIESGGHGGGAARGAGLKGWRPAP